MDVTHLLISLDSLANQFVGLLRLTIAPTASNFTAYGGTIAWDVTKDVQGARTLYTFDFTASHMEAWNYTVNNGQEVRNSTNSYTPLHATGELKGIVE